MANPQWMKGVSGNPSGRPARPKELDNCTREELQKVMWRLWQMHPGQLKEFGECGAHKSGEIWLAAILAAGMKGGDPMRMEWWLTRMIGKPLAELGSDFDMKRADAGIISIEKAREILAQDYATSAPPEIKVVELEVD